MAQDESSEREDGNINIYIEKCSQASQRSRNVLVILLFTSILTFIAFWNSRQSSWLNLRIAQTSEAYALKVWRPLDILKPDKNFIERFQKAKEYATLRGINDSVTLRDQMLNLLRQKQERINDISVTFLGTHFDVNDLGFFSSITFFIFLLWFKYTINRELRCTEITINTFKDEEINKEVKTLLSMNQVFTIPITSFRILKNKNISKNVPLILFLIPLVVQSFIFGYDVKTYSLGISLSKTYTVLIYCINAIFLLINIYNTFSCIKIQRKIQAWFIHHESVE